MGSENNYDFGLSPGSVQSILNSKDRVEKYQHRLDYCYAYLSKDNFEEGHFKRVILPSLVLLLKSEGKSKRIPNNPSGSTLS